MGKHSIKELLKKIKENDNKIRLLELELSKLKVTSRMNKRKVQEELKWTGEETNFAETLNHFCWNFLFPQYKFLKNGRKEFLPDKKNSLYSVFTVHEPFDVSRRSQQERYLGEGHCTFYHEEILEREMQPQK